jgi:hypothetical protein
VVPLLKGRGANFLIGGQLGNLECPNLTDEGFDIDSAQLKVPYSSFATYHSKGVDLTRSEFLGLLS